ncbi:hypothetical protein TNCV_3707511 [Trichonephila clavipes]|nr:hypothetical protein TNCV_3707511 [Trichonephila clavipes]
MLTPIIHFIGRLGSPGLPSSTPIGPCIRNSANYHPPSRNTRPMTTPDRGWRNQNLIPVPCEIQQQACIIIGGYMLV